MKTLQEIKDDPKARDAVFVDALSFLKEKPTNILEIGSLRSLEHAGDGWSTVFFAEHVSNFGGKLVITNINKNDIDFCKEFVGGLFPNNLFEFLNVDGENLIDNTFNLIYLDGSNNPFETLSQFKKCNLDLSYVLVDDFHSKGKLLPKENIHTLYEFNNNHRMALYKIGEIKNRKILIKVK